MTAAGSPAETILLFEAAQEVSAGTSYDASVNRYGTPFYQGFSGACTSYLNDSFGNVPCLAPGDFHNRFSNFSFLDGHAKSMNPWASYSQTTANQILAGGMLVSKRSKAPSSTTTVLTDSEQDRKITGILSTPASLIRKRFSKRNAEGSSLMKSLFYISE